MSTTHRFEEIKAWQTVRKLTREIYTLSSKGAFSTDFGLRDQMRRAAVSVMSNIAEGFESRTRALFVEFLGRAKGSAGELRAQLYVLKDAGYLQQEQSDPCVRFVRDVAGRSAALPLISKRFPSDRILMRAR